MLGYTNGFVAAICLCSGVALADVVQERITIGRSADGRPITVHRFSDPADDPLSRNPDSRPAVAVIAGLDARHHAGRDVAERIGRLIADNHPDALSGRTLYVIPTVNPDGFALLENGERPAADFGRAPREIDADRDRRTAEDPADDLNGDGLITMMRIERPGPETGLDPTHVVDPDDPRIVRRPDAAKGESPTHALIIEGLDNDGDGDFNEDGYAGHAGGGVHLDRNFPTRWPEHDEDAGLFPLSEPETRAIAEWLQSRGNVIAVLTFGPGDNLLNPPASGRYDQTGRVPLGLEPEDEPAFKRLAEAYKDAVRDFNASAPEDAGSLTTWAYADLGVWSLRSQVWGRPDQSGDRAVNADQPAPDAAAEAAPDERAELERRGVDPMLVDFLLMSPDERAAEMAAMAEDPARQAEAMALVQQAPADIQTRVMALAQGQPDPGAPDDLQPTANNNAGRRTAATSEDARWLSYLDNRRGGAGFSDWTRFDHPQLGVVEIGGLEPGAKLSPPSEELDALAAEHAAFVADLLGRLPDARTGAPVVERAADGLYRVTLSVTNPGTLPTVNAIGRKARRLPPEVLAIDLPRERLVSGDPVHRIESIEPGRTVHATWLVLAEDGQRLTITLRSPRFGDRVIPVTLGAR